MYCFVDLDDTLVYTTFLNNDAYNYSLEKFGYPRILTTQRITRDNLKVDKLHFREIIKEKQRYFIKDWLKYRVVINDKLLKFIKEQDKNKCFIWTKSGKEKAYAILKKLNLLNCFRGIVFENKMDYNKSISKLKKISHGELFVVFENNDNFFKNKKNSFINIKDIFFNINSYIYF